MKVVILAGGLGSRLSEYTKKIPKPMVEIRKVPIILHIMKHYANLDSKIFILLQVINKTSLEVISKKINMIGILI